MFKKNVKGMQQNIKAGVLASITVTLIVGINILIVGINSFVFVYSIRVSDFLQKK